MKKMTRSIVVAATLALAGAAPAWAGKLDDWKKVRPDIETALRCEAGFIAQRLSEIATRPELQNDMSTQSTVKPRLEERAEVMKTLGLSAIRNDQECSDKLAAGLGRLFRGQPHARVEDVEKTASSAAGNYLLGRWGVHQARLGKANRMRTGQASVIKDYLQTRRDDQQLRRPINEYGKDPEIQKAAESDPLLAYFITLGDGERDGIADAIDDNYNDTDLEAFSFEGTTYQRTKEALGLAIGFERSIVGHVAPTTITVTATSEKEEGEDVLKIGGGTYALVFFKPMEFTATECTEWVRTGSWQFTDNGASPVEKCKLLVGVKAKFTLFPVAVEPEIARQLKPGSNLDCLLNGRALPVDLPAKKKVTTWSGQSVFAHAPTGHSVAFTSVGEQYNQMAEGALDTCTPIVIADGTGKDRVPHLFLGIAID